MLFLYHMKELAKHIVVLLVYLRYFTVQMGSNFVIQENIRNKQDNVVLECTHTSQKHSECKFTACKKNNNFKKANLNKRFCPSTKNEIMAFVANEPIHYFVVNTINYSQTTSLQKNKKSLFEDRGPPAQA